MLGVWVAREQLGLWIGCGEGIGGGDAAGVDLACSVEVVMVDGAIIFEVTCGVTCGFRRP